MKYHRKMSFEQMAELPQIYGRVKMSLCFGVEYLKKMVKN